MNSYIVKNYSELRFSLLVLPVILLIFITLYFYSHDSLSVDRYILIQKDWFYLLNKMLGQFPVLQHNFTQFGDALVVLAFLTVFFIPAPKMWEALISGSLISSLFTNLIKKILAVPRPAAVFDNDSFVIIGETLSGYNSVPSGHSVTIFTTFTIILFSFLPSNRTRKLFWFFLLMSVGIVLVFSRVALGAHYPVDVMVGGIIGYVSAILGIFFCRNCKVWNWIGNKKYYPFFMVAFLVWSVVLAFRIIQENLLIFYFALSCLLFSLLKLVSKYAEK